MTIVTCEKTCRCNACRDRLATAPSQRMLRNKTVRMPQITKCVQRPIYLEAAPKIQPMSVPNGLVFYLDYTYGGEKKE